MKIGFKSIVVLITFILNSCAQKESDRIEVLVSIPPQAYLVDRIGGDKVNTHIMVKPGQSPELYEPEPAQILLLSRINIYFNIDIPSEQIWMTSIQQSFPQMKVVDISQQLDKLALEHYHNQHQDQTPLFDAHVWTSPVAMRVMSGRIYEVLSSKYPENREYFRKNYSTLLDDLDRVDKFIRSLFKTSHSFLVYHPAWSYFSRDYGLDQNFIELEDKEPAPKELIKMVQDIKEQGYRVLFIQPHEMNPTISMITQQTGLELKMIDSLSSNYIVNLSNVGLELSRSFVERD